MPGCCLAFPSDGERERGEQERGRGGRDTRVVAYSAFRNMRPYFTDIYCSENVFSVEPTRPRQEKRLYTFMGEAR